jgi:AcrR family transcriptional regulator
MSGDIKKINNFSNIIAAAEKLFFLHDYNGVSMRDIAKSVKITKPALYYHFKNKSDLYLAVIRKGFEKFKNELEKIVDSQEFQGDNLEKKIEKIFGVYAKFIKQRNGILKILLKKIDIYDKNVVRLMEDMRGELINVLRPLSEEILSRKKKNCPLSHREIGLFFLGMMAIFSHGFFKEDFVGGSGVVAKKIVSLIFDY